MFVLIQMLIFFIIKLQSLLNESYYTSNIQLFIESYKFLDSLLLFDKFTLIKDPYQMYN